MTQSPHRDTGFGADPAFVASQSSRHGVSTKGFNPGEGAASTLDAFAKKWGVSVDLTSLARQEQAFHDMLATARNFDGSYEAARDRFRAAITKDAL